MELITTIVGLVLKAKNIKQKYILTSAFKLKQNKSNDYIIGTS